MIAKIIRAIVPPRFRPSHYLEGLVRRRTGGRVRQGPFAGMRYIDRSVGSTYVPKLLGIYERELNECIEQACALKFPLIVDVGAAEGYYAVGLALRNPAARIVAFEMTERGRAALAELAKLNGVSARVDIRGKCEVDDFAAALAGAARALVVCDVESYEDVLLVPEKIPALARAHLLVEMHDFAKRGITDRITARFDATHSVRRIWEERRSAEDFPFSSRVTKILPKRFLAKAVSERRPERMSWLWMEPK